MTSKRKITKTNATKKETTGTAIKKRALLDAMRAKLGNVTSACEEVGISRTTFYAWRDSDSNFATAIEDIKEMQIDFAESQLLNLISSGDTTATIFYLKTQGRARGYNERLEVTGRDGRDLMPPRVLSKAEAKELLEKIDEEC